MLPPILFSSFNVMVLFNESPSTGDGFSWLDEAIDKKNIVIIRNMNLNIYLLISYLFLY